MSNTLGYFNPEFYANELLIHTENALGMAERVHRGYDKERGVFNKGDTINIKKPATFSTQSAPGSVQDITTKSTQMSLSTHREVRIAVSDKEMAYTGPELIDAHIKPMAYAIANYVDSALADLYYAIPWYIDRDATPDVIADFTNGRKTLFNNGVPLDDPSMVHCMIDGTFEAEALQNSAFSQAQGSGDEGVATQKSGLIGPKFGFGIWANQNVKTHTKGALSYSIAKLKGAGTVGAVSITIDDTTMTGTMAKGDTFSIAGHTQRYSVTALATAATNEITVSIFPALAFAYADNAVVTISQDTHVANMLYHQNAFAVAFAKLPDEIPRRLGAEVVSIQHPKSGVAIRVAMFWDGTNSKTVVLADVLFGVKCLDANLAVRLRG
jgi:hypothetical protein